MLEEQIGRIIIFCLILYTMLFCYFYPMQMLCIMFMVLVLLYFLGEDEYHIIGIEDIDDNL